jgi:hypothetical protein
VTIRGHGHSISSEEPALVVPIVARYARLAGD